MTSPYDMSPEIIVIDDERMIPGAENYTSTDLALARLVKLWTVGLAPKSLYLDHDMGPDNDIFDVVNWLYRMSCLWSDAYNEHHFWPDTRIFVHSMNPVGGQNIVSRLSYTQLIVLRIPIPDQMVIPNTLPREICGAYYGTGDGAAICQRLSGHPSVSVDGIGHNPYTILG